MTKTSRSIPTEKDSIWSKLPIELIEKEPSWTGLLKVAVRVGDGRRYIKDIE